MKDLFNNLKNNVGDTLNKVSKNDNLSSILVPGAIGGLMGALLGNSKSVKKVAKNAAYIGGGAVATTLAYKIFQKWTQDKQEQNTTNSNNESINTSSPNNTQSLFDNFNSKNTQVQVTKDTSVIIEAIVFAARADGHIDTNEQNMILKIANQVIDSSSINTIIKEALEKDLDVNYIASKINTYEDALDIYKLSATTIVSDTESECAYLEKLAKALSIDENTKNNLDREANSLRSSI